MLPLFYVKFASESFASHFQVHSHVLKISEEVLTSGVWRIDPWVPRCHHSAVTKTLIHRNQPITFYKDGKVGICA